MKRLLPVIIMQILLHFQFSAEAQTIYRVNSLANTLTGAGNSGTLRWCIVQCTGAGPFEIKFDVAGTITQSGYQSEELVSKSNITFDGFSAPGASCGNPTIQFEVDGTGGWYWSGSTNIVVQGIAIKGWVRLEAGTNNCKILGCHINTSLDGLSAINTSTNYNAAVRINGATTTNNTIGGLNDCERNLINGGLGPGTINRGVYVLNAGTGNKIIGNYIGVDKNGTNAIGNYFNTGAIIHVDGGSSTTIEGNVLSNGIFGIYLNGTAANCTIKDNMIGADKNGVFKPSFAMNQSEIYLKGGSHSNTLIQGNVLGNQTSNGQFNGCGIAIEGSSHTGIQILNNYIGVDKNFNIAPATGVDGSGFPVPGGPAWAGIWSRSGNITISGNFIGNAGFRNSQKSHGIGTEGGSNWTITNNWIGVTPNGTDVGNGHEGIEVNGSTSVTITGNVVGFNKGLRGATSSGGIGCVGSGVTNVTIDNNNIGVTPSGLAAENVGHGVWIEGGSGTQANFTISNNRIAYNNINGIGVTGNSTADDINITNNCMWCNGTGAYATTGRGISILGNNNYAKSYTIPYGTFTEVKVNAIGAGATNTDTSGATWIIRGFSPANAAIEVFVIDECHLCTANGAVNSWLNEGHFRVGTTTANASGLWSFSINKLDIGRGVVATATGAGSAAGRFRTSEFSNPICFNTPCLPPKTVSITSDPNPPTDLCIGTALVLTGNYTVPPTGCKTPNYYGTWTKDGSNVSGPTLLSPPTPSVHTIGALLLSSAGTYQFKVEDGNTGTAGCSRTASIAVTVIDCTPLPVDWLNFYGYNNGNTNSLHWHTAVERDNNFFTIERSTDGTNFHGIAIVVPQGSTGGIYHFNDSEFEKTTINYYRIKQTDYNGEYSYSNTISITGESEFKATFYPNPTSGIATLNINSSKSEYVSYKISDIYGRVVFQGKTQINIGNSEISLELQNISDGIYFISISQENSDPMTIKFKLEK
ncbi:MAG: T9SS type A sorting domain-containing protein [Cytophagaceae bacterium]